MGVIPGHGSSSSWDVPGPYKDRTWPFATALQDSHGSRAPLSFFLRPQSPPRQAQGSRTADGLPAPQIRRNPAKAALPCRLRPQGRTVSFTLRQGGKEGRVVVASSGLTSGGMALGGYA